MKERERREERESREEREKEGRYGVSFRGTWLESKHYLIWLQPARASGG